MPYFVQMKRYARKADIPDYVLSITKTFYILNLLSTEMSKCASKKKKKIYEEEKLFFYRVSLVSFLFVVPGHHTFPLY